MAYIDGNCECEMKAKAKILARKIQDDTCTR